MKTDDHNIWYFSLDSRMTTAAQSLHFLGSFRFSLKLRGLSRPQLRSDR